MNHRWRKIMPNQNKRRQTYVSKGIRTNISLSKDVREAQSHLVNAGQTSAKKPRKINIIRIFTETALEESLFNQKQRRLLWIREFNTNNN